MNQTKKLKAIIVTGTPATGKTTVAKALAKELKCDYVDGKAIIKENELSEGHDEKRDCDIIDEDKFKKILNNIIDNCKDCVVIDSHLSHFANKDDALCIVTKCSIKELEKRMKNRNYHEEKIKENIECEIMEICENEAFELGHSIITVDTTNSFDIKEIKKKLKKLIKTFYSQNC